jgi:hypothetical protein
MNLGGNQRNVWQKPGVNQYVTVGICSLGAIGLVLYERGFGFWCLLPILAGLAASPTAFGPMALVTALAGCVLFVPRVIDWRHGILSIPDLVLSGAVLGYMVCHARLQSLTKNIFPSDIRGGVVQLENQTSSHRRATGLVTSAEVSTLVIALPLWALAATIARAIWPAKWPDPIRPEVWNAIVVCWIAALALICARIVLSYWQLRHMSAPEAQLMLQDVLWPETRREQRRVNRWRVWYQRRQQEKNS